MPLPRKDKLKWAGLLFLILGLTLMDRSFANWRDDQRNFPDADGVFLPIQPGTPPPGLFQTKLMERGMAFSGLTLFVIATILLARQEAA